MAQAYYTPFTVQTGQVSGTQSNFPMLINPTDNRFRTIGNGGHVANSNGYDIRPYSDSGLTTALTYELVAGTYIASTGTFEMWVNVASMADGSIVYLGYGDAALNTDGSSTAAWNANYTAVYHFPDGSTLNTNDSTSGGVNGTNVGGSAGTGQIDGGVTTGQAADGVLLSPATNAWYTTECTVEAWVNGSSFPNAYNAVIAEAEGFNFINTILVKSTGKLAMYVKSNTGNVINYDGTGSHTLSTSTWYYLVLTYSNAAGLTGYVNAASDGTAAGNGDLPGNAGTGLPFGIGYHITISGRRFSGTIDEVRISKVVRPAGWITTNYNNQSAPGSFYAIGAEQAIGTASPRSQIMIFW